MVQTCGNLLGTCLFIDIVGVASPSAGGVVFGGGNMLAGNGFAGLAAKASSGFTFGNKSGEYDK